MSDTVCVPSSILIDDVDNSKSLILPLEMNTVLYAVSRRGSRPRSIVSLVREGFFMTWYVSDAYQPSKQWIEHVAHLKRIY